MKLLSGILLILSFQLNAQTWYSRYSIDWYRNAGDKAALPGELLGFRFANLSGDEAVPASFTGRIARHNSSGGLSLEVFSAETEEIGSAADFPNIKQPEFDLDYSVETESGKQWIVFSVVPIRLSESGKVERLKSFILKYEEQGYVTEPAAGVVKKSAGSSVLVSGNWYKIRTEGTGMYKISFSELSGLGIENPASVRVYGWGGTRIPEDARKGTQDELLPVQTYFSKGSDGIFNQGDYLLFYASGPVSWEYDSLAGFFRHDKNNYSDYGYYFLTSDAGPAITTVEASLAENPVYETDSYDFRDYHEEDEFNPIHSGKEMLGELFDLTTQYTFNFSIPGLVTTEDIRMQTLVYSRAKDSAEFKFYANNQFLGARAIEKTVLGSHVAHYAKPGFDMFAFNSDAENVAFRIKYEKPDPSASGMLDYLTLNARARLEMKEDQLLFRDSRATGENNVSKFLISGIDQDDRIWIINDIHDIKNVSFELTGEVAEFTVKTNDLLEFVAFNTKGDFPSPVLSGEGLGLIDNQDLKQTGSPDMVIVTHPLFREEADRLAEYRRQHNDLEVFVTEPEIIYNEFSSGRPDVTAVRNFMRFLYRKAGTETELMPQYLLLFGDGSYKFKNAGPKEGNFVPAYESDESILQNTSYVSDDFFGLLDDGEDMESGLLEIGIGRLPAKNEYEAKILVDKIIEYELPDKMGDWRNVICFIGDDEDYNRHLIQADGLANYVNANYPYFNTNKIFLDAYKQITTSKGERYPEVNMAVNEQVNKGALIINYTGHGGPKGLAHEQILDINDILSWKNKGKLPLFMTATCEFAPFDNPDIVSVGEEVILSPDGGGIALLTTSRLVYAGANLILNEHFYEIVFEKNQDNMNYCLGDIVKYSKNETGAGINKRNFSLLGDPAMRLTYPELGVITDSINHMPISSFNDTIKALSRVTISGHIINSDSTLAEGFNGVVYPSIFDKKQRLTTLGNDGELTISFKARKNKIYKGKATVKEGRFSFTFLIPRDIGYAIGDGKISYYATDSITDATGADDRLLIGGSSSELNPDITGPDLRVFMNNNYFTDGGITSENPVLYVEIFDENGVNTTGNGIGHDITAILNDDGQNSFILNDFYQAQLDSYTSGTIEYPFYNLEEGKYNVQVKVWDIFNNSSTASTEFVVVKNEDLILEELLNSPNPFIDYTEISFESNKAGSDLEIIVDIFTMNGELVKTIKTKQYSTGFRSEPITWDGITDGNARSKEGIYIYRIRVRADDGTEAEKSGRMIIIR